MNDAIYRPERDVANGRWIAIKRHKDPETGRAIVAEDGTWNGPDLDRRWSETFAECLERCRELNA